MKDAVKVFGTHGRCAQERLGTALKGLLEIPWQHLLTRDIDWRDRHGRAPGANNPLNPDCVLLKGIFFQVTCAVYIVEQFAPPFRGVVVRGEGIIMTKLHCQWVG